jgi:hypothetical protein
MKWRSEAWAVDVGCELGQSLDNFETDDKKPPTLPMAVKEAQYIIDLHHEPGTTSNEMLMGEDGAESQKIARANIKECRAFIQKYRNASSSKNCA